VKSEDRFGNRKSHSLGRGDGQERSGRGGILRGLGWILDGYCCDIGEGSTLINENLLVGSTDFTGTVPVLYILAVGRAF